MLVATFSLSQQGQLNYDSMRKLQIVGHFLDRNGYIGWDKLREFALLGKRCAVRRIVYRELRGARL